MKEGFGIPKSARIERVPERESDTQPDGMSRRAFMRGMLANAIAAAVASTKADKVIAAPGYEKTPLTLADEMFFKLLIESPEALANFREDPKAEEVNSLVRALARTDVGWAKELHKRKDFHPGAVILIDRERNFRGNATTVRVQSTDEHSTNPYRYFVVTAKHVADVVQTSSGNEWIAHPDGYDIAVDEIEESAIGWIKDPSGTKDVLDVMDFDMRKREDSELSGEAGVVLAYNTRGKDFERHAYASRISPPLSRKVRDVIDWGTKPELEQYFKDTFRWIAIPPGYAKLTGNIAPASGTSGAAFVTWNAESSVPDFGGIMAAVTEHHIVQKNEKGNLVRTSYALGEVLDRELVRQAIAHAMRRPHEPMRDFTESKFRR